MASVCTIQFQSVSFPIRISSKILELRKTQLGFNYHCPKCNGTTTYPRFMLKASSDSLTSADDGKSSRDEIVAVEWGSEKAPSNLQNPVALFQESIRSLSPVIFSVKRGPYFNYLIVLSVVAMILVATVRAYVLKRKTMYVTSGSVADLVRRGQLRSDRRGISSPLKYEDPFNNPMVKVGKSNSTIEMCGKIYRLAPVTLTREQQTVHQKRRSRAYQWKRPTIFLREGDSIPSDVDPDTVRWIPANHPFATTASDIDEDLAQNNVYQKHGVPFRIQAEHEALQRKLEALQKEQKLNNLVIDSGAAKDFERPFKSQMNLVDNHPEPQNPSNGNPEVGHKSFSSDGSHNAFGSNPTSEELQKP